MTPDFLNNAWFGRSVQRIVMVGLVPFVVVTLLVACDRRTQAIPAPEPTPPGAPSPTTPPTVAVLAIPTASQPPVRAIARAATVTPIPEPTIAPTAAHTRMPTPAHTPIAAPTSTALPTPMVAPTATHTPVPTPTPTPVATPTSTATPVPTVTPTATHNPVPTATITPTPTSTASPTPTVVTVSSFRGEHRRIAEVDLEIAKQVAVYDWVTDGIDGDEWIALSLVHDLAKADVEAARLLTKHPWMADSITKPELNSIGYLIRIAEHDPHAARLALRQPFMEPPFRHRDALALESLFKLVYFSSETKFDYMEMVARQQWFKDGVDDVEAALLKVLGTCANEYIRALIESHYIESVRVHSPLSGDVDLVAIRHTPFPPGDSTLVAMEEGIRAIEGFMGTPFPINDVVLLVVDPDIWRREAAGSVVGGYEPGFYSSHILVNDRKDFLRACLRSIQD